MENLDAVDASGSSTCPLITDPVTTLLVDWGEHCKPKQITPPVRREIEGRKRARLKRERAIAAQQRAFPARARRALAHPLALAASMLLAMGFGVGSALNGIRAEFASQLWDMEAQHRRENGILRQRLEQNDTMFQQIQANAAKRIADYERWLAEQAQENR